MTDAPKDTKPDNGGDVDELDEVWEELKIGLTLSSAYPYPVYDTVGENAWKQAKAKLLAREKAAERRGVAWSIGVIDEMHMGEIYDGQLGKGTVGDKGYKAIKNTIRDRYKAETGVDPAPSYPVSVSLTKDGGEL